MGPRRREFMTLLGGAAAAWPLAARAQQRGRVRRIGALMALAADDPDAPVRVAAFAQGLQELGWTVGENVRIDYRWAPSEADRIRYAAELVALMPDVILATSGATVGALQHASRTVPIVFVTTIDPVGGGWVASLARPGGNATGFTSVEFSIGGKWLELLKEIAPRLTRVAVPSGPLSSSRIRRICGGSDRGALVRCGIDPGRRARCQRDQAWHNRIRTRAEWGSDHGRAAFIGGVSS